MSDEPLMNAAVERLRQSFDFMNELAEPPSFAPADFFTDDFVLADRRRGGVNFGELNASDWVRVLDGFWEAGGQPRFSVVEVIAVRGEWSAAYRVRVVYGVSDMFIDDINVVRFEPVGGRFRRTVLFDPDDRDAAIAELDRMHADIDDEPDTPS
jgi:hypothetical protein